VIPGEAGSGIIGVNGAAARLTQVGHRVIVMSFVLASAAEIANHSSCVVIVDDKNRPAETIKHATGEP
jgi:aspartate 1-decarboxylase